MDLGIEDWKIDKESSGQIFLTSGCDIIQLTRTTDELSGECWFFDYNPADRPPVSAKLRIKNQNEAKKLIQELIEEHT